MKCVDCNAKAERGHLCNKCFDARMKDKIYNEDRVVENPGSSWF